MAIDRRPRAVIERVRPAVNAGRFPVKRCLDEALEIKALVFADGHDRVRAVAHLDGPEQRREAREMRPWGHDQYSAELTFDELGAWSFRVEAWVDRWSTWLDGARKKRSAGVDTSVECGDGALLLRAFAEKGRGTGDDRRALRSWAERLERDGGEAIDAIDAALEAAACRADPRAHATWSDAVPVVVDPPRARFTAWYELFPRSASPDATRTGTLRDVEDRLPYVQELGFDTLYLPPIHPIGRVHRKGRNNARTAEEGDVGSPWAIGAEEGGHTAVHPQLGTVEDLERLARTCRERGIELALDIAFQCAPDHPWVKEHPNWFKARSDGTIQYAENPPKKYEDIYPIDFESDDWEALWAALRDVFMFWIDHGVRTFRVDNPHTKPLPFWEWALGEVKRAHPDVVFLSEAFTRPNVAYRLAKAGFTQSYDYFPWKNTKWEIEDYFSSLTEVTDFFRASSWTNTPDILTEYLQFGGRAAASTRLILAATLSASYGVYGPVFELGEVTPREPGSEEYLDSEKYQVRHWTLDQPHSLRRLIQRINRIRRENRALQSDRSLRFHPTSDDAVVCYSKRDGDNAVVIVANTDPHNRRTATIDLDLDAIGVGPRRPYQVHEALGEERFLWSGARNVVDLEPGVQPAKIFRVLSRVRTEADFDYFM